jgi:hypothetical protein
MGYSSLDDAVGEITSGKTSRFDWNKITGATAYVAGRGYDMSILNGTPIANAFPGTALAWRPCDALTGNGTQVFGLYTGGNVSPDTKHCLNTSVFTTSATGLGTFVAYDMLGYWPGISNNTTAVQTLTGTPVPRWPSGGGYRLFAVQTVASGATAQNINLSYTNQAGTSGRTMPFTVSMTPSAIVGQIPHMGTAANNYGPFLPMFSGADFGVQNVASVTMSAANTGTFALVLGRVKFSLPTLAIGVLSERDFASQYTSYPQIKDNSCVTYLFLPNAATAASSSFFGHLEQGWS